MQAQHCMHNGVLQCTEPQQQAARQSVIHLTRFRLRMHDLADSTSGGDNTHTCRRSQLPDKGQRQQKLCATATTTLCLLAKARQVPSPRGPCTARHEALRPSQHVADDIVQVQHRTDSTHRHAVASNQSMLCARAWQAGRNPTPGFPRALPGAAASWKCRYAAAQDQHF